LAEENRLIDTFVTLADTLVADYDVIDFMQTLAERSVELLDVSAAGIMLSDPQGNLRHIACSSEEMRLAEVFELQIEEGPCFDAYSRGTSIRCDSPENAAARWPRFAPHARERGFASVSAVPMRLRAQIIGALNLFSASTGALGDTDLKLAQALADVATIGILQERTIREGQALASQLQGALESRVVIEQAKGVVAERHDVTVDDAFNLIRRYARSRNLRLSDTARQIIEGTLPTDRLDAPSIGPRPGP
jgi:transcriptional regulator with GAF, ATPase, and Fis domain